MLKPKTQNKPSPSAEFEAAKARWVQVDSEWQARQREIQSIRVALSLANNQADRESDRTAFAREIAGKNLALAMRRPEKLGDRLTDLQFERDELHPAYVAEYEAHQAAMRRETTRISLELQPRQRRAVKAIAAALEALSKAINDERDIHADLAARSPLERSPYLPRCTDDLAAFGDLSVWNSKASNWGRKMLKMEILTDE